MMYSRDRIVKWGLYALLLWFICVLQIAVPLRSGFVSALPLIPLCCLTAIFEGRASGGIYGLCAGLLCDAFTPGVEAYFTVTLALCGMFAGAYFQRYFRLNFLTASLWAVSLHAGIVLLYAVLFVIIPGAAGADALYYAALPEVLLTLPYYPLIYLLVKRTHTRYK